MTRPTTMSAARIHAFGGPEVIRVEELDVPSPAEGELLVEVRAVSVNGADLQLRQDGFDGWAQPPLTLGMDLAGVVVDHGAGVTTPAIGTRVHGRRSDATRGTLSTYVAIPADEVVAIPDGVDDLVAAAIPLVGLAAWQSIHDLGELTAGQRVLIQGAGGSVGHLAVQLAKELGATVVASDGPRAQGRLEALGADEVYDHRQTDVAATTEPVDLVIDTVGGPVTDASMDVLRDGGRLVTLAGDPDQERAAARDITAQVIDSWMDRDDLKAIDERLVDGRLAIDIGEVVGLERVVEAHQLAADGVGKVVITLPH
ncbi:MAG: NADP-dependent oxidoreductase [Nitriliruptoraceae bacterium]|nr:NADP-dependent oxidoreductase [Nitriliruptoraceae bacterium]